MQTILSAWRVYNCVLFHCLYSPPWRSHEGTEWAVWCFRLAGSTTPTYRTEMRDLTSWCLDVRKTKELPVDYRRLQGRGHTPIYMEGTEVERVRYFRLLVINISEDLSCWHHKCDHKSSKTAVLPSVAAKEVWHGPQNTRQLLLMHHQEYSFWLHHNLAGSCNALDHKALWGVVKSAQRITRSELPVIQTFTNSAVGGRPRGPCLIPATPAIHSSGTVSTHKPSTNWAAEISRRIYFLYLYSLSYFYLVLLMCSFTLLCTILRGLRISLLVLLPVYGRDSTTLEEQS